MSDNPEMQSTKLSKSRRSSLDIGKEKPSSRELRARSLSLPYESMVNPGVGGKFRRPPLKRVSTVSKTFFKGQGGRGLGSGAVANKRNPVTLLLFWNQIKRACEDGSDLVKKNKELRKEIKQLSSGIVNKVAEGTDRQCDFFRKWVDSLTEKKLKAENEYQELLKKSTYTKRKVLMLKEQCRHLRHEQKKYIAQIKAMIVKKKTLKQELQGNCESDEDEDHYLSHGIEPTLKKVKSSNNIVLPVQYRNSRDRRSISTNDVSDIPSNSYLPKQYRNNTRRRSSISGSDLQVFAGQVSVERKSRFSRFVKERRKYRRFGNAYKKLKCLKLLHKNVREIVKGFKESYDGFHDDIQGLVRSIESRLKNSSSSEKMTYGNAFIQTVNSLSLLEHYLNQKIFPNKEGYTYQKMTLGWKKLYLVISYKNNSMTLFDTKEKKKIRKRKTMERSKCKAVGEIEIHLNVVNIGSLTLKFRNVSERDSWFEYINLVNKDINFVRCKKGTK